MELVLLDNGDSVLIPKGIYEMSIAPYIVTINGTTPVVPKSLVEPFKDTVVNLTDVNNNNQ